MAAVGGACSPTKRHELIFRRGGPSALTRLQPLVERAELLGREPLRPLVGRVADLDERRADALAALVAGRELSERASALRRWAKPSCTSARSAGRAARGGADEHEQTESTFGTGWKTVRATGRCTRTSQESWARTDGTP